jgi:hypothetical protein
VQTLVARYYDYDSHHHQHQPIMEMSSPLAAMHPPPIPGPWGYRRDLPQSKPLFGGAHSLGPKSFNFRDLSMKKSGGDYFTLQPMRGSSPTTSLAADMSSNLHMDQRYNPSLSLYTFPLRYWHALL